MQASGEYLNQLFQDAKKSGKKAAKHFEEEDIHKWRVAVKKIKAAFLFFQFFDHDLNDEEIKPLKKIFGSAGKIRELQLLRQTVEKYRNTGYAEAKKKLLHDLHDKEKKAEKKFKRHLDEDLKNVLEKLKDVMLDAEKKVPADKVSGYFQQKIDEIVRQMQRKDLTGKDYHEIRKQLKALKYNLSFADEDLIKFVFTSLSEKELSLLEETLGNWHDQIIIMEWLKKFSDSPVMDENVRNFITVLIGHSQRKAGRLLHKIQKQFKEKVK